MSHRPLILILCTGNSCRSQMAEGFLAREVGDLYQVASAGSQPTGEVHPLAVRVMGEVGVDLSRARSKSLLEFEDSPVQVVITVCGFADEACPVFPGQLARHHFPFDDPARAAGTEEEILAQFRRIRDEVERVFTVYGRGLRDGAELGRARDTD